MKSTANLPFRSNFIPPCAGIRLAMAALVVGVMLLTACSKSEKKAGEVPAPLPSPASAIAPAAPGWRAEFQLPNGTALPPEVTAFAARKEKQARDLAAKLGVEPSPDFWAFFTAAKKGDWSKTSVAWRKLDRRRGQPDAYKPDPAYQTPLRQLALDVELAAEQFAGGNPDYARAFARDIIQSIPPGSVYFGGTDPGRGLVTALCKSHEDGDPFFTITQNALTDGTYLKYVEEIYGEKLKVATGDDSQHAFQDYLADAQRRLEHDQKFPGEPRQIKPGEDVRVIDNRVQVSGQVAVMAINGLLAKKIFDQNPSREFFIEESFPLDWMYPHLAPHGLILQLNREPLERIDAGVIAKNDAYWAERLRGMIGDWLRPDTSVADVCAFAEKVFNRQDLTGFKGDPKFVDNEYATKTFSKLRSVQGGLYLWRANNTKDGAEKKRMQRAADFAFRQALALCPRSAEAVFRYVNLLIQEGRIDDALLVAETAQQMGGDGQSVENLVGELRRMKQNKASAR